MSLVWVGWFLLVLISFAAIETFAIKTKRATLSASVWKLSKAFPPLPWVIGNVTGGLAVHFWPF